MKRIAYFLSLLIAYIPFAHGSTLGNFESGFAGFIQIGALIMAATFALAALLVPFVLPIAMRGKGFFTIFGKIFLAELWCGGLTFASLFLSLNIGHLTL